jgi:hypothetical protein
MAAAANYEKHERLRKQAEEEAFDEYNWKRYTRYVAQRTGKGAR